MNLPDPSSTQWNEYMEAAFMAEMAKLPKPLRPDDELIPGRDDVEGE